MDNRWNICCAVVCILAGTTSGAAAPDAMMDAGHELARLHRQSRIEIDGQKSPEMVPYAVRMKIFFHRYARGSGGYQVELKSHLKVEDQNVLAEYAARHEEALRSDQQARTAAYDSVMSRAADMNGVEIASSLETAYHKVQESAETRYRSVLERLSPEGRAAVERFAFDRIRPSMMLSNEVAVAGAAPEFYKAAILAAHEQNLEERVRTPQNAVDVEQPPTRSDGKGSRVSSSSSGSINFSQN